MIKNFAYKARDHTGRLVTGVVAADGERAVAAYLQANGYFVTALKEVRSTGILANLRLLHTVGAKELRIFCRQFAILLTAGVPVLACLRVLAEQSNCLLLKNALRELMQQVSAGESLSRAMQDFPLVFPQLLIKMIAVGETAGVLDVILNKLATQYEQEYKLQEKLKSVLVYPLFVLFVAIMAVLFILIFVLPSFAQLFVSMQVPLPWLTQLFLAASNFLLCYGWWLLLFVLTWLSLLLMVRRQLFWRQRVDGCLLHIPIFGTLWRKIAIARLSRALSILLRGGIPMAAALEVVQGLGGNTAWKKVMAQAQAGILRGAGLSDSLRHSSLFTPLVLQMIEIGEESGKLDELLEKLADYYENDAEYLTGRLSAVIEPLLIGALGLFVGMLALAVMSPVFEIVSGLNTKLL